MAQEQLFAFVLMPFDPSFDDVYKFGIKETAISLGVLAERVDEQMYSETMLERIYRQIDAADLIIADMSGQNPNVFYEVGYAHAKKKLCILLTQKTADIPFDLKHHRHIVYGSSIQSLRAQLGAEMVWAKTQLEQAAASRFKVTVNAPSGDLERNKWFATGSVDFRVDMHNEAEATSPELEAIYFYCGSGWTASQGGVDVPNTASDLTDFMVRHFLTPPVRKLYKGGWAQLKFSMRKVLAYASHDEPLMNAYHVKGRAMIRLITNEGNFEYPLNIDVHCDEIPF